MNKNIDEDFTNEIIELENGWIRVPSGEIFTPNDVSGLSAYEVYENHIKELENPTPPNPTLEEVVKEQEVKISNLTDKTDAQGVAITNVEKSQTVQDTDILVTQDAIDFLMLQNTPIVKIGANGSLNMSVYIANRIIKKGNMSVQLGQEHYKTFLTHPNYAECKSEVDLILTSESREELIADLTVM